MPYLASRYLHFEHIHGEKTAMSWPFVQHRPISVLQTRNVRKAALIYRCTVKWRNSCPDGEILDLSILYTKDFNRLKHVCFNVKKSVKHGQV